MIGIVLGLVTATVWALGSITIRELARKLDPFTLNAPRALVGGLAMLLLVLATGRTEAYSALTWQKLVFLLASIGIGGGIGDSLYVVSMSRIGVSRAFPIASSYPALTLVFGLLFLQEQIQLDVVGGLILVLAGILIISRPASRHGQPEELPGQKRGTIFGVILALLASLCWAVSMMLVAPGLEGLDSIMVASIRTPALSLMLWGVVASRRTLPTLRKLNRRDWIILLVGGLIGWGLGSVLFLITVSMIGPTRAAILTSTSPLFALPLSVIFLKEKVTPTVLVGTALTVVGIVLVS